MTGLPIGILEEDIAVEAGTAVEGRRGLGQRRDCSRLG